MKARFFSLVTYLSEEEIVSVLNNHSSSVVAYAYIYHDRDNVEPHYHLVLRLSSSWTSSAVLKWFKGFPQNSFIQIVHDRSAIVQYLTHENESDKFHYSQSDIVDAGLSDICSSSEADNLGLDIVEDIVSGVPTRELVRRYGRDFIIHSASYFVISDMIMKEEGLKR